MTALAHDWFPRPLPAGVTLGAGAWLYSAYAFVHDRSGGAVRIGAHSGVYHGTFFDLGPHGSVDIGEHVTVVGGIFATDGPVHVGDDTFIAHEVVLADASAAVPGAPTGTGAPIRLGENVWIAARAVVLAPCDIGEDVIVGAGAVVTGEVPPGAVVVGNPAQVRRR